jgi:transcriptional regulator with XRE-family HTH domain
MSHELQVRVGARIARARREAGLTQRELALRTGHAVRTVQTWELGTASPRSDAFTAIAEATGRPHSWFYETDDQPATAA